MNRLSIETRAQILALLCEGTSMRATSRLTGASTNTVAKLLVDAGTACAGHHDETVRGVVAKNVQADEIWSFAHCKQKNVEKATAAPVGAGDVWTWAALDAGSKLLISYLVGGRDAGYANEFMADVADRITGRCQLTTDGLSLYLEAVENAFGSNVDYAQLAKTYGTVPEHAKGRYSPAVCTGARKVPVSGDPMPGSINTRYVERQNLTMRMHMRRFTRLTNAFSKKVANHAHMVALYTTFYNFAKVHKTLRVTPAMEAGLDTTVRDFEWVVGLIDARAPAPAKRGPYKKRQPKAAS